MIFSFLYLFVQKLKSYWILYILIGTSSQEQRFRFDYEEENILLSHENDINITSNDHEDEEQIYDEELSNNDSTIKG